MLHILRQLRFPLLGIPQPLYGELLEAEEENSMESHAVPDPEADVTLSKRRGRVSVVTFSPLGRVTTAVGVVVRRIYNWADWGNGTVPENSTN